MRVEQHDVWTQLATRHHLAPQRGLADYLDVLRGLESPSDSFDHKAVVVRDENLHAAALFSPLMTQLTVP